MKIDLNILNLLSDLELGMNITNRGPTFDMNYPPIGQKMYPIGMPRMSGFGPMNSSSNPLNLIGPFIPISQIYPLIPMNQMGGMYHKLFNISLMIQPINIVTEDKDSINNLTGNDNEPGYYYHFQHVAAYLPKYWRKRRKYEGGYLNGKRHGKGKEYFSDPSLLQFEGEYKSGLRNGYGKEYSSGFDENFVVNAILSYEGEYLNGKRNGTGKKYLPDGTFIEVKYVDGIEV